jgi:hypothetical protein
VWFFSCEAGGGESSGERGSVNAGGVDCDIGGDSPALGRFARRSLVMLSVCLREVLIDLVRGEALGRGGNGR